MRGNELSVGRPCPACVAIAPRLAISSVGAGVGGSAAIMVGETLGVLPCERALVLRARDGDLIDGEAPRFQRGTEFVDRLNEQVACHFGGRDEVGADAGVLYGEFCMQGAEVAGCHFERDITAIAGEGELHGAEGGCLHFTLLHGVADGLGLGEERFEGSGAFCGEGLGGVVCCVGLV